MRCVFYKYHGAGNDFIIIDNRKQDFIADKVLISELCHRRFGIGADGLLLLGSSGEYDFSMRYFNSDGGEGSMCGNGGRCIAAFAYIQMDLDKKMIFSAIDGIHQAEILEKKDDAAIVRLKMADVEGVRRGDGYYFVDTGSPHYVVFVENADKTDVVNAGRAIRYSPEFPKGTNVNFVEFRDEKLYVRTYERGVEDETLSCGTGVTASAIAASFLKFSASYQIMTRGGDLKVHFVRDGGSFREVWLEGPATCVYMGEIEI